MTVRRHLRLSAGDGQAAEVLSVLREAAAGGLGIFMAVDAARDRAILRRLAALEARVDITCLWQNHAATEMADVAPYLVPLPSSGHADALVAEGWGRAWGIFILSRHDAAGVRRALRRLTMVRLADGRVVYFRFYDPRVLPTFLDTADAAAQAFFFRGLDCVFCESETGPDMLRYDAPDAARSALDRRA